MQKARRAQRRFPESPAGPQANYSNHSFAKSFTAVHTVDSCAIGSSWHFSPSHLWLARTYSPTARFRPSLLSKAGKYTYRAKFRKISMSMELLRTKHVPGIRNILKNTY